ncbi:MAG: leucyl aminopeptidase [Candidatus Krumholzibacteriia bacterium]
MQWKVTRKDPTAVRAEVLVVPVEARDDLAAALRTRLGKDVSAHLAAAARATRFRGKAAAVLPVTAVGVRADCVLLVGLGPAAEIGLQGLRRAAAAAAARAREMEAGRVAVLLPPAAALAVDPRSQARCWVEGAELALSPAGILKSSVGAPGGADGPGPRETTVVATAATAREIRTGVQEGEAFAAGTLLARRLVNLPANHLTPADLADEARRLAAHHGYSARILGPRQLERAGMGAILGVSRGSRQEPRLIILKTRQAPRRAVKVALVGKGVTFDSGGISLKPGPKMEEMKADMAGGAAVLGAALILARLQVPVDLRVLIPAVENLPDGDAIKPADVLTTAAGKTVEVLNTDAEGRLILADALHLACAGKPDHVIDIATLTGACQIALGEHFAGLMGHSGELNDILVQAGGETFERVWPLPVIDEHRKAMEGTISDLKNLGGREGGALTAAAFLSHFVPPEIPWAHLDMAGTALGDGKDGLGPRGATGYGARLLARAVQILAG